MASQDTTGKEKVRASEKAEEGPDEVSKKFGLDVGNHHQRIFIIS